MELFGSTMCFGCLGIPLLWLDSDLEMPATRKVSGISFLTIPKI